MAFNAVRRVQPVARGATPRPVTLRPLPLAPRGAPPDKAGRDDRDYGPNLEAMRQAGVIAAHEAGLTGEGVVVGLLDTGFRTTHEVLAGLPVVATWDFVNGDPVVDDEEGDPAGSRNHGTMVLSTLAARKPGRLLGPAPGVAVLLAKTEDVSQEVPAEEDHWVAGLEWLEAQGADLVSSSLAYRDWYDFADLDGDTAPVTVAADAAAARGLPVINAAGNDRHTTGTIAAPADGDSVITVGAVTAAGAVAWFSSPGPTADGRIKPDVAALGVDNPVADPNDGLAYLEASGTSFATPLVAGVAALALERVPDLSPVQLREALRQTASHPATPDNDTGWGIVDAWAAATWWGPVYTHTPLKDTEDTAGPYAVAAGVVARAGLDGASLQLAWRADGGPWQTLPLTPTGGGSTLWSAAIPGQPAGTRVEYHLAGADAAGLTVTDPVRAPARVHAFTVGPDVEAPELAHRPLPDQTLYAWPPTVRCTARDNLGLAGVALTWRVNGGPLQGPAALTAGPDDAWSLPFPVAAGDLADGDAVTYTLTATDLAAAANTAVAGPHALTVAALARADTVLTDAPGVVVPDGDPAGLNRLLSLDTAAAGTILGVEVGIDLTHPAPEQLTVILYAPDGTEVTLHDHGGAGTTDLVGTWPVDLAVSGPGSLDDLVGADAAGPWVLHVADGTAGDFGVLESWSLRLTLTPGVSSAGDTPGAPGAGPLTAAPNPFNPRTELAFALASPVDAVLTIHDVRGRLVRRLLDRPLPAGRHAVRWDGRDDRGRAMASGVYLARLEAAGTVRERKLTLVR